MRDGRVVLSGSWRGAVMGDYEGCGECGKPQWSCGCWEEEAGTYRAGAAEGQARLEQLRDEAYGAANNPAGGFW